MVNLLHILSLGFSTLFFAAITAASPFPHVPRVGEIVHYGGGQTFNPHITVGHDHRGHAILAQVVHGPVGRHPSVSAHGMGTLTGKVLLHTVVAHPDHVHQAPAPYTGQIVSANHVANIRGGQELVKAHLQAAHALEKGYQANRRAENAHRKLANKFREQNNLAAAQAHEAVAEHHRISAGQQSTHFAVQHQSANFVHGANPQALQEALGHVHAAKQAEFNGQVSESHAKAALAHLKAAKTHDQAAEEHRGMGNQAAAQIHAQKAVDHRMRATWHSPSALNSAPDPNASMDQAHTSSLQALESIDNARLHHQRPGYYGQ